MMITPADTPPQAPPQLPGAPGPGPAPVPYAGPGPLIPAPLAPDTDVAHIPPGDGVMQGVSGNAVQESGYAHDMGAGAVAPFYGGKVQLIFTGGDDDAGGRDDVSSTVAGAVANAEARFTEHWSDNGPGGGHIGDLMTFPGLTATGAMLDPGAAQGVTDPAGGFYDPPRNYGG